MNWYLLDIEELRRSLGVGEHGLTEAQAAERLREHGPNELEGKKRRTVAGLFLAQFKDLMILVLLAAAAIAGAIGDLTDTYIILAIVLLNAVIGVVQEFRAEKALDALKRMAAPQATVRRGGSLRTIAAREVVPGDLVVLEAGQVVPADLRFTACHGLRMQEAALTGESLDTAKQPDALEEMTCRSAIAPTWASRAPWWPRDAPRASRWPRACAQRWGASPGCSTRAPPPRRCRNV
ncbi:MAG: hypothetical protein IPG69_07365 [Flavobacteriales bacterium]|nr:hypothetical protein [Flavobacteriales bacterium]